MYTIKIYEPGVEEAQAQISNEKKWTHFLRLSAENICRWFENGDLDPSLNFYAFLDEVLVGYLISSIETDEQGLKYVEMELPIVKKSYEDAQDLLIQRAFDEFKKRGVGKIKTSSGTEWDNLQEFPEKFGFKRTKDMVYSLQKQLSDINISSFPKINDIQQLDPESHKSLVWNYYKERDSYTDAGLENFFDNWLVKRDKTWIVIRDEKLAGLVRLYEPDQEIFPGLIWIRGLELKNPKDRELVQGLFRFAIEYAREKKYTKVDFNTGVRDIDLLQFQYIGEIPIAIRYELEKEI